MSGEAPLRTTHSANLNFGLQRCRSLSQVPRGMGDRSFPRQVKIPKSSTKVHRAKIEATRPPLLILSAPS